MALLSTYLVEDSVVIRDSLIATLEDLAPVVVLGTAADEETAIKWLGQVNHKVDLVIVDLFLAGGSGLGVLRRAGRLEIDAKLVVLSNYATPEIRRTCLELGADEVFDKSADIDALIQYCIDAAEAKPAMAI